MSYCTVENIKERIPEKVIIDLTQDDKVVKTIGMTRLSSAILDSDSIIDSKLSLLYSLPLTNIPSRLIRIAVDLTIYFLYRARFDNSMPDTVKFAYDDAMKYLNGLQNGDENLVVEGVTHTPLILTNQLASDLIYSKELRATI